MAELIRRRISDTPVRTSAGQLSVTASFGIACYPDDGNSLNTLFGAADAALYHAKRVGRDRTISAQDVRKDTYSLGNALDAALREGRVLPAYQPIVELQSGDIVAEETLARVVSPDGDVLQAGQFIHAAEQLQLLHRVDEAIITRALSDCAAGLLRGEAPIDHYVNISADLLRHRERVEKLLDNARAQCKTCAGLVGDVKPVIIEITERELLADLNNASDLLTPFLDFGFRLALDDFGSGFSSYHYLADLPISVLKVDGALIQRVKEPKVRAIVQGIQDTAVSLNIKTVAEFVEDAETESVLKEVGIDMAQGFYYGRPGFKDVQPPVQH